MSDYDETIGKRGRFRLRPLAFTATGLDFMKIAVPNLLLTIVTLGIYRFWATTRERQYLWGQTQFIDERLEWTGTGMELFIGFIMVFFLIGIPFAILQLVAQGADFSGAAGDRGVLTLSHVHAAVLPDRRRLLSRAALSVEPHLLARHPRRHR